MGTIRIQFVGILAIIATTTTLGETIGTDPLAGSITDMWNATMVIQRTGAEYTNATGSNETITIETFNLRVGENRGRVTPFVVQRTGAAGTYDDYVIEAIGDTRISGTDYNAVTDFSFPFAGVAPTLVLAPGETLAAGFLNASPDGTMGTPDTPDSGSVISYSYPGGVTSLMSGGASNTNSGNLNLGIGAAPTPGNNGISGTNTRAYNFNIGLSFGDVTWDGGGAGDTNWSNTANWNKVPSNGANLTFGSGTFAPNNDGYLTEVGDLIFTSATPFTLSGSAVTLNGDVTNNSTALQTIDMDLTLSAGSRTFNAASGDISIRNFDGSGSLVKTGGNVLLLSENAGGHTGTVTVDNGTLRISNAADYNALGNINVTVNSPGILDLNGTNEGTGQLNGDGSVTLGGGLLVVGYNNADGNFSGVISGSGSFEKAGTGTQTLSGSNTYTGDTTVGSGDVYGSGLGASLILANLSGPSIQGNLVIDGAGGNPAIAKMGAANQFGPNSVVELISGAFPGQAILKLNGHNQTIAGLSGVNGGGQSVVQNTENEPGIGSATLTINNSADYSYAGLIRDFWTSGTGTLALTKTGIGTQTLSGDNTYTGLTTVSGGTLQIGNGGTTGSIPAGTTITNNASLVFNRSDDYAHSGDISGTGSVTKGGGTGILTLSGTNTYTGGTTITNGTLRLGAADSIPSTGDVTIDSSAIFDLNDHVVAIGGLSGDGTVDMGSGSLETAGSGDFAGVITGSGGVTKSGSDTQIVSGDSNAYTGGTTISAGTLQIGAGGTTGSLPAAGDVTNNSALSFNRSNDYTYAGAISGTGSLTQDGPGTTTLTGNNTYTGPTTVTNGRLVLEDNTNFASPPTVNSPGTLELRSTAGTWSFGQPIGGTGSLVKSGSTNLRLTAANTLSGTTRVEQGVLELAHVDALQNSTLNTGAAAGTQSATFGVAGTNTYRLGGLAGTKDLALGANSIEVGANNADATFGGPLSGTGGLTKRGTGTQTLAGPGIAYTGNTTVTGGRLLLDDATNFASDVAVGPSGTLELRKTSGSSTFNNAISGSGAVRTTGAGSVAFGGNNAGFTGSRYLENGSTATFNTIAAFGDPNAVFIGAGSRLDLTAATAANGNVFPGSGTDTGTPTTYRGTGTIDVTGGTLDATGVIFKPGNSPGILHTAGNLTNLGTYNWQLLDTAGPAGSPTTGWDLMTVSGIFDVGIGGTLNLEGLSDADPVDVAGPPIGLTNGDQITFSILTAGSIIGNEALINVVPDALLSTYGTWTLAINGNSLDLLLNGGTPVPEPGTWALFGLIAASCFWMRRQRKGKQLHTA